jgi:hypothetical protein
MTLYGKDEADDLTAEEKRALRTAIAAELKVRAAKKPHRPGKRER